MLILKYCLISSWSCSLSLDSKMNVVACSPSETYIEIPEASSIFQYDAVTMLLILKLEFS